ncbi:MAG: T9SS type A sorting domain-containing protein [Cyclobacteriaceae bacterium]
MKKQLNLPILLALCFLSLEAISQSDVPAFPTAEGYGMWASGGRGGKVVEVTSLEDRDRRGNIIEGGFRWALQQYPDEPITVVFKVSGIIDLNGADLRSKRDNVTIAGQTAPGDGICIKGGKVNLGGSNNLILRHLRFRVGLLDDGGFIEGGALGYENGSNFIIDHCTFGWSGEENMTIYDNKNTTVQWCLVHEGLYDVGHPKGVRGYGTQWGGETSTYHHNLLANNVSRTPRINGAKNNDINVLTDFVNNVNFNWGKKNSCYGGEITGNGKTHKCNWINNYYKPGPARDGDEYSLFIDVLGTNNGGSSEWYLQGNFMEGTANEDNNTDNYLGIDFSVYTDDGVEQSTLINDTAFEVPYELNVESAEEAFSSVLDGAGAFPRDTTDLRIIKEVKSGVVAGSGAYGDQKGMIDDPDVVGGYQIYKSYNIAADLDHDGMADYWEAANALDSTNAEDRNTLTADGYTVLEVYLNYLAGEMHSDYAFPDPVYLDADPVEPELSKKNTKIELNVFEDGLGQLIIESMEPIASVVIYDLNGRIVQRSESKELDISKLRNGLYVSRVEMQNGEIHNVKFVK